MVSVCKIGLGVGEIKYTALRCTVVGIATTICYAGDGVASER